MITVLYVLPHPPKQSETFVLNEIRTAMRRDDIRVLVVYARPDGRKLPRLSCYRLRNRIRLRDSLHDLGYEVSARHAARNLARALEDVHFDIVHAHFASFPARVAIHLARHRTVPVTLTAHAADYRLQPIPRLRTTLTNVDHVFAISDEAARTLSRYGAAPARISTVRAAVDPDFRSRDTVAVDDGKIRLLSVARLVEKKGIATCVRAAQVMRQMGIEFVWDVVGAGPLAAELITLRDDLGLQSSMRFLGEQNHDRVLSLIRQASIGILICQRSGSGDEDGIPVFLLECAAIGVPIITTAVGGITDLVDEVSLGIVQLPSHEEIAGRVNHLWKNDEDRSRLAESLQKRFVAEFDPFLQVGRYVALWAKLVTKDIGNVRDLRLVRNGNTR